MSRKIYPSIFEKIVFLLYLFSLSVPALVFSGRKFVDFLYIVKWASFYVPFFIIVLITGFGLLTKKIQKFNFDIFAIIFGALVFFCAGQYFFVHISSKSGFLQEMLCFASLWLFYVFASEYFPNLSLTPVLWCACVNAALNVGIAELQTRGLYTLEFLKGTSFEFLMPLRSFIYDGLMGADIDYIGNIGQHNMLGLWLAICTIGAVYLFLVNVQRRKIFASLCALFFVSVNIFGLLSGNSRSGLLSMLCGIITMAVLFIFRFGRKFIKYLVVIALVFAIAVAGLIYTNSLGINRMLTKIKTPEQYKTVAGR
ncbi:MAG: hypothetical protein IJ597_06235, partial [Synergistaceae bacterium]|nr:hypothetical protein [Synergistaceae bacterium]